MLSPPDGNSPRSQSSLSLRSRALTASSALSACTNVDTRFRRQVYQIDVNALRAKAAGKKDSRPISATSLHHVSTTQRSQGPLHLDNLLAIARGTRASSVRSLSTTLSFGGSTGEIGGIQGDHWSTNARTLDRACSQEGVNLTRLMPKPNVHKRHPHPLTRSIDNMHLVNSLPRSPQLPRSTPSPSNIQSPRMRRNKPSRVSRRGESPKEFTK